MSENITLMGTGQCFEDAFFHAYHLHFDMGQPADEILIVHALVNTPELGDYVHAWVEWRGLAFQTFIDVRTRQKVTRAAPIERNSRRMNEKERRSYSLERAFKASARLGSRFKTGPWHRPYLLLCGDVMEALEALDEPPADMGEFLREFKKG